MMTGTEFEDIVIKSVCQMLSTKELPTTDMVRMMVDGVVDLMSVANNFSDKDKVDKKLLVKKIEARCNISVPDISILGNTEKDHEEWFFSRRAEIQWRFWERYKRYLEETSDMPLQAISRLDDVTNQILSRLEDPSRSGTWDRRGMVVGQVQSGKTSNYTALICKAADAGYKLIIVLAGMHDNLRSQTQLRLDEGLVGFDTQRRKLYNDTIRLGVGLIKGVELYRIHPLTSSDDKGDFNVKFARQANFMIGGADPILLVVKKNTSVLNNLYKWCIKLLSDDQSNARNMVHGVPLLLIDDEADNASINIRALRNENGTIDPDLDPSKINGKIRQLLKSFAQSAYVGYTATPFANIFIPEITNGSTYGEDLFPRSFIVNLQPPSNYLSPVRLFGLADDREAASSLPLIRHLNDYENWVPDKHKKDHAPGPLPGSVKEAIKSFILTCAVRYARGKITAHNSMLIHVTRFTAVQSAVFDQVKEELQSILNRLHFGDGNAPDRVVEELKILWRRDFLPTMEQFSEPDLIPVTWKQVEEILYKAASKIEVKKINGTARDTLQYVDHKDIGLSVICIGGDKLSRGLTLEGLSISYYLRASEMYDTLMQMGRWFGYRNGYIDVCRLYTTPKLESWYRDIAASDEELRLMFEEMAALEGTPQDYGLGVRTHPEGLLITARNKMQAGHKLRLSYSQRITETVAFFADRERNRQNLQAVERMIRKIETGYKRKTTEANYVWEGIPGEVILDFLGDYQTHRMARTARSSMLKKYIQARITDRELIRWTVVLISIGKNEQKENHSYSFTTASGYLSIGVAKREGEMIDDATNAPNARYSIGRLVSPKDEFIDLPQEEYEQALQETKKRWKAKPGRAKNEPELPSGVVVREMRPAVSGLLLLYLLEPDFSNSANLSVPLAGFAMSFPKSDRGSAESAVEYMVNETYWQQVLEEDEL